MEEGVDLGEIAPQSYRAEQGEPLYRPRLSPKGKVSRQEAIFGEHGISLPSAQPRYRLPNLTSFADECRALECFSLKAGQPNGGEGEALARLLRSTEVTDPVEKQEIDRLLRDLQVYQSQPPPIEYQATPHQLSQVIQLLAKEKQQDRETLQSLEKQMLALANKSPSSPEELAQAQLKSWGGQRKVITPDELIVNFARHDPKALLQRNPFLTDGEINLLVEMVGSYLLHAVRDQQRTRAEKILEDLEASAARGGVETPEYQDYLNQLAKELLVEPHKELLIEPCYDPLERPAFLVFEYYANLSLRKAQVKKMERFLEGEDLNLVMEMIMGSGKSKVLLPLLGMMRADGDALSMVIVPQSLFESVAQDTQTVLQDAFSQSLHALQFDRNTSFTKRSLETILDDLNAIRANGECLIITSKSVQCFILKYIEESPTISKEARRTGQFLKSY